MEGLFSNCLELGSGVGLSGIMLAAFQPTVLTDYKLSILENISYNIESNCDVSMAQDVIDDSKCVQKFEQFADQIRRNASVSFLDWTNLSNTVGEVEASFVPGSLMKQLG